MSFSSYAHDATPVFFWMSLVMWLSLDAATQPMGTVGDAAMDIVRDAATMWNRGFCLI